MAEPVFIDGLPKKIDTEYFRRRHGQNFPDLLPFQQDEFLEDCIDDVYTMFTGVSTLWESQSEKIWFDKTRMCYSLLSAWFITDTFPEFAVGIPSMGGMPIRSKSIGGVKVVFGNPDTDGVSSVKGYKDRLAQLKTNPFGYKAYNMINSGVELTKLRGRKRGGRPNV